jgi:hypothetical protein
VLKTIARIGFAAKMTALEFLQKCIVETLRSLIALMFPIQREAIWSISSLESTTFGSRLRILIIKKCGGTIWASLTTMFVWSLKMLKIAPTPPWLKSVFLPQSSKKSRKELRQPSAT